MSDDRPRHLAIYCALLKIYPLGFRRRYEREMVRLFVERHRTARSRVRLWVATIWDTMSNGLTEQAHTIPTALGDYLADARFARRQLTKSPIFALVAVTTLAFGVGANVTIFGFVNALVFRPLDVPEPDRLVRVDAGGTNPMPLLLESDYEAYRDRNQSFDELAMFHHGWVTPVRIEGATELIAVTPVSGNYFQTLGVTAVQGRTLVPDDDTAGAPSVVVLSDEGLKRYFGGDTSVVGRTIFLNNQPYAIVGVTPASFKGTVHPNLPQIYATFRPAREIRADPPGYLLGRLKAGLSISEAEADLERIAAQLSDETGESKSVAAYTQIAANPQLVDLLTPLVALVWTLAAAALWVACSNIAMLLLARAATRRREMGIRLALGAGRARLLRQLFVESALLAVLGGIGAAWAAHATSMWLSQIYLPVPMPIALVYELDAHVIAFTIGVSFAATLLFGLGPAIHSLNTDVVTAVKQGEHATAIGRSHTSFTLIVTQVAVSAALLAMTTLMTRSVVRPPDPRFDTDAVLIARTRLAGLTPAERADFVDTVLKRLQDTPGIVSVTAVDSVPLTKINGVLEPVALRRDDDEALEGVADVYTSRTTERHFETLGIPLLRGRDFSLDDGPDAPPVAIVNETLATRFWPGESPIGKVLVDEHDHRIRIVGMARDSKYQERNEAPRAFVYRPLRDDPPTTPTFLVKTALTTERTVETVREHVGAIDPDAALFGVQLLSERIKPSMHLALAWVSGTLGLIAVMLGAVGTYGLVSWSTHERRREFALRLALGAPRSSIVRLTTRQGTAWAALGVLLGFAFYLVGIRFLRGFLIGVSPFEPLSFVLVAALLLLVAYVACRLPAARVARSDPSAMLRE